MDKNITDRQLKYYYYTALKHFLFLKNIYKDINKYSEILLSEEFLNAISIFVKVNQYIYIYNNNILHRIQDIVNYIRESGNIDKNKYFPLINEIIIDINILLANHNYDFNVDNLFCLEASNRIANIKSINLSKLNKNDITDSILNDFIILDEHLFNYEDNDTFLHTSMKWLMNPMYYYSLNAILSECNDLFDNKLFVKNARLILDENDKIMCKQGSLTFDKNINDFDKNDVTKIKKLDKSRVNKLYFK